MSAKNYCQDCGYENHTVVEAVRCSIHRWGRGHARQELLTIGLSPAQVEDLLFKAWPFTDPPISGGDATDQTAD